MALLFYCHFSLRVRAKLVPKFRVAHFALESKKRLLQPSHLSTSCLISFVVLINRMNRILRV